MTPDFQEYVDRMYSRYGLVLPVFQDRVSVFGGVGMARSDFSSIADVASKLYGDEEVALYELETTDVAFAPVDLKMDEGSLRALKGMEISHFDLLAVPRSKNWAMALTSDLDAVVYGDTDFVDRVRRETKSHGIRG